MSECVKERERERGGGRKLNDASHSHFLRHLWLVQHGNGAPFAVATTGEIVVAGEFDFSFSFVSKGQPTRALSPRPCSRCSSQLTAFFHSNFFFMENNYEIIKLGD